MPETQKEFDWNFASQIATIRRSEFDPVRVPNGKKSANVTPLSIKCLIIFIHLRAGEDGWCWASLDTLCTDTGMCRTQLRRVLKAIRSLGLLVENDKRVGSSTLKFRRLAFSNLKDFDPKFEELDSKGVQNHRATVADPQGNKSIPQGNSCHSTGQQLPSKNHRRTIYKEPLKSEDESLEKNGKEKKGWCLRKDIQPEHLNQPLRVLELYDIAIDRGYVPAGEAYQIAFFGLCHRMWQWHLRTRRDRPDSNAVGLMHKLLSNGVSGEDGWSRCVNDDDDRAWAKKALRELEGVAC